MLTTPQRGVDTFVSSWRTNRRAAHLRECPAAHKHKGVEMRDSRQLAVARERAVFSPVGMLRVGASVSAGALMLALSACSDGGLDAGSGMSSNADPTLVAKTFSSQGEVSLFDSESASDHHQVAASAEEKALALRQGRFAPAALAASPAAPQAPFIPGKIVAAALSFDLNQVGQDVKTAYLGGDPAAEAIQLSSILAKDLYFAGSNGIIPNNRTPYSCCLAGFPSHSIGALYSYVTGGLTLSDKMNVWTASTPRDSPVPTVMVRQEGDLAIQDNDKVLLNTTHANWIGPSPYYVQLQVASDTDPEAFRLCWHVIAPLVRRLSCGIYSRDSAAFRGTHVIDDSAGVGPRTFRTIDPL